MPEKFGKIHFSDLLGEYSKYAGRQFVTLSLRVPTECILCGPH